jgi:lipopolysaccharide transport system ATP-binding protein
MTQAAIKVSQLSKAYRLGKNRQSDSFRDVLVNAAKFPFQKIHELSGNHTNKPDAFWALNNVSFTINQGDVVGIIGRNGAGKSTLLKILSRITEPTTGEVELRGRVSSLLEVGTGFHPELSGRENIYLNGSILGMKRSEIKARFDGIVAFAEVEKFLDTPVKRYSSGMYVRLAFAVAAHLEPEILIVDEVLAVGDLEFQKKCLGKMGEVASQGRTVLIVSHNMSVIQSLCTRSILLRQGALVDDGPTDVVVKKYLRFLGENAADPFTNNPERGGSGEVRFTAARVLNEEGNPITSPIAGKPLTLEFDYENNPGISAAQVSLTLYNDFGIAAANLSTRVLGDNLSLQKHGRIVCRIPNLPLPFGEYRVAVALQDTQGKNYDHIPNALVFNVKISQFYPSGLVPETQYSTCLLEHTWDVVKQE